MKDRPVILYLMRFQSLKKGSFEKFLIAMAEKGEEEFKFVFVFQKNPPDWLGDSLRKLGAEVDSAEITTRLTGFRDIDRLIRIYEPKIVHTHFFWLLSPVFPYLRWRYGVKVIAHIHSSSSYNTSNTKLDFWLLPLRKWLAVKSIDIVISVSEFIRRKTVSNFSFKKDQVITIHNGVEISNIKEGEENQNLRLGLGISKDTRVILSAAWLTESKGIHVLINSLPEILVGSRNKDIAVVIAGDGPERTKLESLVRFLGIEDRVFFLGWRDDVPNLIRQADIVIVPSICEEGCSYFVLESMVAGKPIVASQIGGIVEKLGGEPPAGILFPPGNSKKLSKAILNLINNDQHNHSLSVEAKRRSYNYNISDQIKEILGVYHRIV